MIGPNRILRQANLDSTTGSSYELPRVCLKWQRDRLWEGIEVKVAMLTAAGSEA